MKTSMVNSRTEPSSVPQMENSSCRYCNSRINLQPCDTCGDQCCRQCLVVTRGTNNRLDGDHKTSDSATSTSLNRTPQPSGFLDGLEVRIANQSSLCSPSPTGCVWQCERCYSLDLNLFCFACGSESLQSTLIRCHNRRCRQAIHTYCLSTVEPPSLWLCPLCESATVVSLVFTQPVASRTVALLCHALLVQCCATLFAKPWPLLDCAALTFTVQPLPAAQFFVDCELTDIPLSPTQSSVNQRFSPGVSQTPENFGLLGAKASRGTFVKCHSTSPELPQPVWACSEIALTFPTTLEVFCQSAAQSHPHYPLSFLAPNPTESRLASACPQLSQRFSVTTSTSETPPTTRDELGSLEDDCEIVIDIDDDVHDSLSLVSSPRASNPKTHALGGLPFVIKKEDEEQEKQAQAHPQQHGSPSCESWVAHLLRRRAAEYEYTRHFSSWFRRAYREEMEEINAAFSGAVSSYKDLNFRPSHPAINYHNIYKDSTPFQNRPLWQRSAITPQSHSRLENGLIPRGPINPATLMPPPNRSANTKTKNTDTPPTPTASTSETFSYRTSIIPPHPLYGSLYDVHWGQLFEALWPHVNRAYQECALQRQSRPFLGVSYTSVGYLAAPYNTLTSGSRWQKVWRKSSRMPSIKNIPFYIKELLYIMDRLAELIQEGTLPGFHVIQCWNDLERIHALHQLWPKFKVAGRQAHDHSRFILSATTANPSIHNIVCQIKDFHAILSYRQYVFINTCIYDGYLSEHVDNHPPGAQLDTLANTCSVLALKLHHVFSQFGFYAPIAFCESPKLGVFLKAVDTIPARTVLAEYCGKIEPQHFNLTKLSNDSNSIFDLWDTGISDTSLCINPEPYTNIARFLSHSSGKKINVLSCTLSINDKIRIFLVTKRKIDPGETLFINYNAGQSNEYPTDDFSSSESDHLGDT